MKTVTGYLAILLGVVGAISTIAVILGAWWAAFEIASRTQQVTIQAEHSLLRVEEAFARMSTRLNSTAEHVEAVRVAAEAAHDLPINPTTEAKLERLRNNLLPLLERVDSLNEALPPIAQLLDHAAGVIEQTGKEKQRADKLRSVADRVRQAATALESIRERADSLRRGETTPPAKLLADLAQRARVPLDLLTTSLSDVQQESEDLRGKLPKVLRTVNEWKILGPAIATVILVWIGLGQLSIVGWGRRRLAARTPPPIPASPAVK